jgi:adenylate cyclase
MAVDVVSETFFELPFPRSELWPVLGRTDWLNRAVGLPPVSYETRPLPEGGAAVFGRARIAGVELRWREWPFEWREPDHYIVRRDYETGPLRVAILGVDLLETPNGTRLRVHATLTPRNAIGRLLIRSVMVPQANRAFETVVEHLRKNLIKRERPLLPKLPVSPVVESVLAERLSRLRTVGADSYALARLEAFLRQGADVEMTHIRPRALAREWKMDDWDLLRLLLVATRNGLFQFRWEVLCPNCRSSRSAPAATLSGLKREAHCDVCDIRFDGEFDQSVELKFSVHPGVRPVPEQTFCLAGPGGKPHVVVQALLQPGEEREWRWPEDMNGLRLRSPQVAAPWSGEPLPTAGVLECRSDGFAVVDGEREVGLRLRNPNAFPVQIVLERVARDPDVLTAAEATNWQLFRELFATEVVSPDEQVTMGEQVVLFTDLRGSTAMYHDLGDAAAYARVRDHFGVVIAAIQARHGGVVKTIGDAVMAVFSRAEDGFAAADAMFKGIDTANRAGPDRLQLVLKAGLHAGPCLAVNANDRLDYFGTTINLAARLVDCSRGGELAVSDDVFARASVRGWLGGRLLTAEPGQIVPRGFTGPVMFWRIAMGGDDPSEPGVVGVV